MARGCCEAGGEVQDGEWGWAWRMRCRLQTVVAQEFGDTETTGDKVGNKGLRRLRRSYKSLLRPCRQESGAPGPNLLRGARLWALAQAILNSSSCNCLQVTRYHQARFAMSIRNKSLLAGPETPARLPRKPYRELRTRESPAFS